jgi:hypothetical protein
MANVSEHSPKGQGNDFVQLLLRESAPLGMEISRDKDGAILVSRFQTGGQAERSSTEAMIDPQVFQNVTILGVNGMGASGGDPTGFLAELKNDCRPKSILFGMRNDTHAGIRRAIDVHKRYDNNFVELVFRKAVLGIKLNKTHDVFLQVDGFQENTEAVAICDECLLDPNIFKGASITRVNGKPFRDKIGVYEALKCPKRPKSILFELATADHAGKADAVMTRSSPAPSIERRASLKMRERAAFASTSMRTLAVDDYDRRNDLLSSIVESIPHLAKIEEGNDNHRNGPYGLSSMSESIRKLEVSISEMEKLNAMNDQEALSRSTSSVEVEESPRTTKALAILRGIKKLSVGDSWRCRFQRRTESGSSMDGSCINDGDDSFDNEKSMEDVKKEAYEACLCAIRDHLDVFLSETPYVTYEEWIEELHPENAQSRYNLVGGKSIDHRFYVEGSDHRRLWNERSGNEREFVPVRDYLPGAGGHATASTKAPKTFARGPPVCKGGLSVDV